MWNTKRYWFKGSRFIGGVVLISLPARAAFFSSGGENTRGPSILKRDVGVRALGLGGAVVGETDDPSALHWNPAGIHRARRQEVQFMHAVIFADQTHDFLGYLIPYWRRGERKTLGVTVSHLAHEQFEVVDNAQSAGSATPSETVVGLSLARPAGAGSWGVTGKWVRQDLFDQQGNAFALDAGFRAVYQKWGYGISMANLGSTLNLGDARTELPLVIRAGLARAHCSVGRGEATVVAQIDIPADDQSRGRVGLEWACPIVQSWRGAVRSGYRTDRDHITLGAGIERGGLEFNYAHAMNGELGATHFFDLTFRFGSRVKEEVLREELVASARVALEQGQYSQASERLDALQNLSPRARDLIDLRARLNQNLAETIDPVLLWRQGQEARAAKKLETAALHYRKLLIVQPDHPDGIKALRDVEKEIELTRAALAQEAVRKARVKEVAKFAQQARDAAGLEEWPTAVKLWKRVVQGEGPGGRYQQESLEGMARAYSVARQAEDAGQIDRAVILYRALMENPSPYQDSAQRHAGLLEREAADRRARGQSIYEDGLRAYGTGDLEKARVLFEQARELAPNDRAIQKALERLNTAERMDK